MTMTDMAEKSRWSTWNGFDIDLTTDGQFRATKDDIDLRAPSLVEVRDKIDSYIKRSKGKVAKEPLSLDIVGIADGAVVHTKLVGVNRATGKMMFADNYDADSLRHVMADTPDNARLLADYIAVTRRYNAVGATVEARRIYPKSKFGGRIEPENYPAHVQFLRDSHAKSAAPAATEEKP